MGFFSKLFNRNPTADWHEIVGAVTVDIALGTVIGQGMSAKLDSFRGLGPASAWPGSNGSGTLGYRDKGIDLDFEYGQFVGAMVVLNNDYDPTRGLFTGKILRGGAPLAINAGDDEQRVREVMHKPENRDDDEDETILLYRFGDVYAEFELHKPHGLSIISIWHEGEVDLSGK